MADAEEPVLRTVEDHRRPAHGWGRILVVVDGLFGLVVGAPAFIGLVRHPEVQPVAEAFNIGAGLLYVVLAVCLAHNGRRMRMIGWMSVGALLTGDVLIGVLSSTGTTPLLTSSLWAGGGSSWAYLPLVLPLVTIVQLWVSQPRRIVVAAEMLTDLGDSLRRSSGH